MSDLIDERAVEEREEGQEDDGMPNEEEEASYGDSDGSGGSSDDEVSGDCFYTSMRPAHPSRARDRILGVTYPNTQTQQTNSAPKNCAGGGWR
jgi:hypothetical protein